ncbi:MAG: hypothetical protein J0L88_00845 [Xanthomonadales bacterium]|nr:hypothetical protein [Xanthomonadales bacterium]
MRSHWDFFKESDTSMGVFYPLHYVLAAFETDARAHEVRMQFLAAGFAADNVAAVDGPFLVGTLESLEGSGLVERAKQAVVRFVGTEMGYIEDDRKTAARGAGFLFVYTPDEDSTQRAIELLRRTHPIYARRYNAAGIHRISYPRQSVL